MQRKDIDFLAKNPTSMEEKEQYVTIAHRCCRQADFKAPYLAEIALKNPTIACQLLGSKAANKLEADQLIEIYQAHCLDSKFIETMTRKDIKEASITLIDIISRMEARNVIEIFKNERLLDLALKQLSNDTNKTIATIVLLTKAAEYNLATLKFLLSKDFLKSFPEDFIAKKLHQIYKSWENNTEFKLYAESKEFPNYAYLPTILTTLKTLDNVDIKFAKKDFFQEIYRNQTAMMKIKHDPLPSRPFFSGSLDDDLGKGDEKSDKKDDAFKSVFGRQ